MAPATAVEIRPATSEDATAIAAVARRTWEHDYPAVLNRENVGDAAAEWYDPDRLRETVRDPAYLVYVADRDGVCGFVQAFDDDETGVVLRAYVAPGARGGGVGRALVERVCEALFDRGCERVTATVLDANEAGRTFYEALGFEPTDETGETNVGGEFYDERTYVRPEG